MNSPFDKLRTNDVGRLDIWPGPKTLTVDDYESICKSDALFARKFNREVDVEILFRLAKKNGYTHPTTD